MSDWNKYFVKGEWRIRRLNFEFLFFEMCNEKPRSSDKLDHLERNFGLDYMFSS